MVRPRPLNPTLSVECQIISGGRPGCWLSPIRRVGSARPPPPSTWPRRLALNRQSVLLVDIDPQGNLTSGVGLRGQRAEAGTIYEALMTDASPESFVLATQVANLSLMPGRSKSHRRGNRAGQYARPRAAPPPRARPASPAVRPDLYRLSAVTWPAHAERAGRRRCRGDSAALRVLRARRAWPISSARCVVCVGR